MKIKNIIYVTILLIFGLVMPVFAEVGGGSLTEPPEFEHGEILYSQSRRQLDAVNPTAFSNRAGSYFPGARGANQLVLYTSEYGQRTRTNEFGTEAVIEGNTVVELSGADSFIPPNSGAVLSGHGEAKTWINQNISVGTKIYYDPSTGVITTYTTSQSYITEAMKKIEETVNLINYYKNSNPDYDWKTPSEHIKDAQNYVRKGAKNPDKMKQYAQMAIQSANEAMKSVLPFKITEFKGVWLRPTATSREEIVANVQKIKSAGIDNVFIETYFHGRTIFPSKTMSEYGFVEQNEKFSGFDPLRVWIDEAHKNGIKVHIWFETFYVGNTPPRTNSANILAVHPEWGNKTLAGYEGSNATPSASEHNGYFLDPSNSEVKKFLKKLLEEIITTYNPDGINLDYIRYPQALSASPAGNWGYTENARDKFYQLYGIDPITLKTSDPLWSAWGDFRRKQISDFVKSVGEICRKNRIYLSAVIFPDKSVAYSRKLQDWATWSQEHYLQGFTPLFLTCDFKTLNSQITTVLNYKAPETDLFAGLFVTFMGGSEEDLIRQIHETRKLNVNGVILFDYAHLGDKYVKALSTSVFAKNKNTSSNTVKINYAQGSKGAEPKKVEPILRNYDPNRSLIMNDRPATPTISVTKKKR